MRLLLIILALFIIVPNVYALGENQNNSETTIEIQNSENKYTFEDNALQGKIVKLKKGTTLPIMLLTSIDTSVAQKNDEVLASLDEDLVYENTVIAKKGSIVYGKVVKANKASKCLRGGKVKVDFDKIVTTDNATIAISAKEIEFSVQEQGMWIKAGRFALVLASAAAYTVLTGGTGLAVIAVCAVMGLAPGINAIKTEGPDAVIPSTTQVEISLDSSLNVVATY